MKRYNHQSGKMFSMKNFWPFTVLLFSWISEVHLRNYIPRFETTQLIQVQKGQYVEISFEIWTYASGTPCVDEEYLEIRDGYNQSANLLGVFCGNGTTGIRRSSGRNLWLKFSSSDGYWFQNNSYYSGKELNETTTPNLKLVPKTQFVLFKHSSSLWCPAEGGPAPYIVWRKNGAVVQNSTSVRYWLTITEEEENPNYSCEVETHNGLDQKNISLVIERCPEPCQCTVLEGNIEGFISVNCERKLLHSVPQNLPGTTIKLVVSENQLEDLPPRVFSGLNWLSTLDLSNNHLKDFPPGVFDETRHLTRIWLGNNNFKELPEDLFVGQDRIRFLRMKGNQLQQLPRNIFKDLSNIEELDLSYNKLQTLPEGFLNHSTRLRELFLNNNNLRKLPSNFLPMLAQMANFSNLTFDFNKLETLPHDIFKFHKLYDLWLGNNNFKELPEDLLEGQNQLRYLRLSGNQLKELPRNIFKHLPDLEELDLSYNQLQKLPRDVLSNNVKLKKLDVSNNNLQCLPWDVFRNVTQLKMLFLSNNKLRHLPSFRNLSQLAILYTSNNSLSTLASDQFQGLSNLRDLAVYNNKIQYLPPRVFEGAKNLLSMNFHLNNIPTLNNVILKDVAPNIQFLYFHNNEMRELPEGFFSNMKDLTTSTVDTNLMCCHLTKEDADCDFVYVDSFANCESMFRNPAPRKCIWVIGILSLVGAVFVIVWRLMFKEKKKKNKIQSIMLMHLAGSDGLMGVYLIIVGVMDAIWSGQYFLHDFPWRSSLSCQITGAIALLSCEVSVMLIAMLSADRVKNIVFPYRGRSLSCKVTHLLCIIIWIIGCIIAFLPTVGYDYFGKPQKGHHFYGRSVVCLPLQLSSDKPARWEYSVAMFVDINFSLVFSVIIAYTMILYNFYASSRRRAQQVTKSEKKARSNTAHRKRETAIAKRVFVIVLTNCLCWLPIGVIGMRSLLEKSFSTPGDLTVWIAVFVLPINSAFNPILYTFSTPQVRGILKTRFRPLWSYLIAKCRRNQNNEGQEKGIEMNVMEEVQNQEDVESDDSDEKSEDERSDHQQQAKPGDHGEPAEQQEGETGGQEQPKEDHDGHEEKKDKPDQQGTKGDHEESEQQHVETDLRKPKVDPKECKEQKVEPVKRKGQKEDHGKPEEQQVKLGQEKASKGGSKEKTEEDTDDEPLEHELLIVDKEQDRQDDNISEGSG
ncbi:relaxin receptor 2-like [Stylophora pistillata]|uniref:relaxin receptor 2-like n=1 Tax=Stylophora pistillata TaxID=50429 RepID=UPI000C03FBF6|nr:relaxin receptor 2-like [Stylophora pistillata]